MNLSSFGMGDWWDLIASWKVSCKIWLRSDLARTRSFSLSSLLKIGPIINPLRTN